MKIVKERTRIIFTEYTPQEKQKIDDLVGTMDRVYSYEDPDSGAVAFPPGMEDSVRKAFPSTPIIDNSDKYWPFAAITPVEHNAQPRNQLQIDFINFVVNSAKEKKKVAGILSPGTGKGLPLDTKIPAPIKGFIKMRNIEVGSQVIGSTGRPVTVTGVYDQGVKPCYKISFIDGREIICDDQHLWNVRPTGDKYHTTMRTIDLFNSFDHKYVKPRYFIPVLSGSVKYGNPSKMNDLDAYDAGRNTGSLNPNTPDAIPDEILYGPMNIRKAFIQGFVSHMTIPKASDTDSTSLISIRCKSNALAEQVVSIIRSLAINCTCTIVDTNLLISVNQRILHAFDPDGFPVIDGESYVSTDDTDYNELLISDIEYYGELETRCIKVDADDSLFLCGDYLVTHNTFMACYSAIKVGLRTLIIVPTSGIKVQWAETLINMFNVDPSRVVTVNSPKDFVNIKADFVIVSQASLATLNKTYDLESIMHENKFGIKVIDEVQMWFHNIIKVDANSCICHNWYLTGTFGRSGDEENALYQEMFGDLNIFREKDKKPTIFNRKPGNVYGMKPHMHVNMMWTHSNLSKEEIKSVTGSMRYSERAGKWMRYGISIPAYTELVIPSDGSMTVFLKKVLKVIQIADKHVDYGKMLILSPTIASVNVLKEYVSKLLPNRSIGTINSKNSKAENDRVKAECDVLISTVKSCGTGFDVKDLSKLVVAEQFKSWILADQVSGRLRRRDDGKDTYMWDIVDATIPQLRAWANARADVLKRKSKMFKVIDI